ncbi:MAG: hypothetical protein ACI9UU_003759, partial [Candidatus Azotimanducaceae bacterium]
GLNFALTLRRSAVPTLRKQAQARTPGLFSACGLAESAMFNPRSDALCDSKIKNFPFGKGWTLGGPELTRTSRVVSR